MKAPSILYRPLGGLCLDGTKAQGALGAPRTGGKGGSPSCLAIKFRGQSRCADGTESPASLPLWLLGEKAAILPDGFFFPNPDPQLYLTAPVLLSPACSTQQVLQQVSVSTVVTHRVLRPGAVWAMSTPWYTVWRGGVPERGELLGGEGGVCGVGAMKAGRPATPRLCPLKHRVPPCCPWRERPRRGILKRKKKSNPVDERWTQQTGTVTRRRHSRHRTQHIR